MRYLTSLLLLTLPFLLTSCATDSTVFKHQELGGSSITTADAKQRAIISNRISNNPTFLRICAEPFPDIFTVISSSLSASVKGEGATDAEKSANVKLGLDFANALKESGASIERSQTVNLLAMSLYRTCERYMNNAISEQDLEIQAMRDQQAMISILAIEQLTNIARPGPVHVALGSGSVESGVGESTIKELAKAKSEADAAKALQTVSQAKTAAALKGSSLEAEEKCKFDDATQQKTCDDALASQAVLDANAQRQEEYYQKVSKLSDLTTGVYTKIIGQQLSAATPATPNVNNLDHNSIEAITKAVVDIAKAGMSPDINQLRCILNKDTVESYRACNGGDVATGGDVVLPPMTIKQLKLDPKLKDLDVSSLPLSNIKFYVQSQKYCDNCDDIVRRAKEAANAAAVMNDKQKINNYPVEYFSSKTMPVDNEIRFYDHSKQKVVDSIVSDLGKAGIKVIPKLLKIGGASPDLIEFWVGKQ